MLKRPLKSLILVLWLSLLFLSFFGSAVAASPTISVLRVEGTIVPAVADYIDRGISEAENRGDMAVIVEISTPGGLYDSTQIIVERILNAKVPVVSYVYPSGAWAASAGTFITLSAHVAAMSPASRIGAAHPVGGGSELTPTQEEKITEDAAALMRSIAKLRGRNSAQAEAAVRQSKSYTDTEALDGGLVDLRAQDLPDLLSKLDGRKVTVGGERQVTLNTAGATVRDVGMSGIERFLQIISNPNVAYILLTIGSLGILAELYNPGMIFPGVLGGVSLLLGFYALGVLNASWGGAALILLAFGLFIADVFVPSHGILTAGGVIALVTGSLVLFSGNPEAMRISLSVIIAVVAVFAAFFAFVVAAVVRGQHRKVVTGRESLIGATAVTLEPLDPEGVVLIEGERWAARVDHGAVEVGEEVLVKSIDGLKLSVAKKLE